MNLTRKTANLVSDNGLTAVQGNIGIGSTNPTVKLDVNGVVNATSFTGDATGLTGIISESEVIVIAVALG